MGNSLIRRGEPPPIEVARRRGTCHSAIGGRVYTSVERSERMSNRLIAGLVVLAVIVLAIPLLLFPQTGDEEPVRAEMEGDVAETVARMDLSDLPAQAEALLATDRPWRAARVMRRYLDETPTPPPDHRLLAARAEAAWGAWDQVHGLLDRLPALETYQNGVGLYLLARALDERGDVRGAIEAYRAFLAFSPPAGTMEPERSAARLRLALALTRIEDRQGAQAEMDAVMQMAGGASVWLEVLRADALALAGDTTAVRSAVARFDSGILGLRAWRARIEAARQANDLAAARALANQARAWAGTDGTRAEFLVAAARAALDMGDAQAGRAALRSAIDRVPASPHARAAAALLAEGAMRPEDHLAVARVYRAQGLHEASLDGYRRWLASGLGTAAERSRVHMEHANALFYAERYDEVEAALRPIASQTGARMLLARTESHRGNVDASVRIYLAIADAAPGSGNAIQALYLAAGARHDHGDFDRARTLYQRVVARHPGTAAMGLSLMRLAGMAFVDEDYAEAARLWEQYRSRYPRGTLWLQSTYWSGRAHEAMGDEATARSRYQLVRQRERDSYYALRASERLGEAFWPLPMGSSPGDSPAAARTVAGWMSGVDLLRDAGFAEEASAEVDRIVAGAGSDRATLYALAEALAERGYAQRAIRIGLRLGTAQPNRRLLRIMYPFPYRTLITEEARDRGLDPFVAAALIRQESMFEARITSHVGARGLMQIMPATGHRLADAVGLEPWDAEVLYHPEINVHLGIRYLAQHMDEYDGSLPAVFSAYNAGSHRVEWWSEFPEYGRDELFTERIPFRETRDYVKILTRNHALYRGLYADG
jgi:soluble lytic murein transglycosylase